MVTRQGFGGVLALLLFASALACDDPGAHPSSGITVVDSAGIRLVVNRGPDRPISVQESLRIGVLEGDPDYLFNRIRSLVIDTAGGIWVTDSHEAIRHFGSDGAYLGSVGGKGEGPGESPRGYSGLWGGHGVILALTYDATLQLFSQDGPFLGSSRPRVEAGVPYLPLGQNGEDWNLRIRDIPMSESELVQARWIVGSGPVTAPGFDTLLTLPGRLRASTRNRSRANASFFYGVPDVRGDGRGRVYYSDPMEYRIEVFGGSGDLVEVFNRDIPGTPYTSGLHEEVEEGVWEGLRELRMGQPPDRDEVAHLTDRALPLSAPDHLPFLEALFVSAEGHVWAQRADRHPRPAMRAVAAVFGYTRAAWLEAWRAPLHFDLFLPDGSYRGSVVLPDMFTPMAVTGNRIVGSIRDELDVQYVVAYSLGEVG